MNIRIFKLVDGSELIGNLREDRASFETYTVDNALEIKYRVGLDGMASAVMTRYNYFGDEKTIKLNATGVIASYAVSPNYVKVYEESLEATMRPPEEPAKKSAEPRGITPLTANNTVH